MEAAIILLTLFILIFLEVPIFAALCVASVVGIVINPFLSINMVVNTMAGSLNSFPLVAIPYFILAGNIMGTGSMARKLVNVGDEVFGRKPGGMAVTETVACAFFAALSGSAPATTSAIGGIMLPEMTERGYRKNFVAALTCSAGIMGPVIPPSISFILYGVYANVSISDLFIAGIIPGIMMAIACLAVIYFNMRTWGKKEVKWDPNESNRSFKRFLKACWDAKFALAMPIIILGGIYGGIVTPTEAAVVAVVYSLVVSIITKDLTAKDYLKIFKDTIKTSGIVMVVISSATAFGNVLNLNQIPDAFANAMLAITSNPYVLLFFINIILLIVGALVDTPAAIAIMVPLLVPIATGVCGMSGLAFGVMMVVNLMIGQLTPPVGCSMFVACGLAKIGIKDILPYLLQFILALFVVVLILTYFPIISDFLPALIGK